MARRKAVIVAAGLSSRLYPLTEKTPKGLLAVGDETLLGRSVRLLRECGIAEISVVVGFQDNAIRNAIHGVTFIANPFYRQCNNMGSLFMSRSFAGAGEFLYLHGDLIYSGNMLRRFIDDCAAPASACIDLLVDSSHVDEEAMKVAIDESGRLIESSKQIEAGRAAGEWTGIALVRKPEVVFGDIERYLLDVGLDDYDTASFTRLAQAGNEIRCLDTNGEAWKEIDSEDDLASARETFGTSR